MDNIRYPEAGKRRPIANLLPEDGIVNYYGRVVPADQAANFLKQLLDTISWKHDEAVIFGRHITTKRKAAWYGDREFAYAYSGTTKTALPWTGILRELKVLAEHVTGSTFNSCLLNLYHTGDEGMAWHSDDEKALAIHGTIASLSFGAARRFALKHKRSGHKISLILESGSLLVMKGETQSHWLHSLPKSARITEPRVNLTFRTIVP